MAQTQQFTGSTPLPTYISSLQDMGQWALFANEPSPCYSLTTLGNLAHKQKKRHTAFEDVLMSIGIGLEQCNALLLPENITLCWTQRILKNREINPVIVINP